MDNEVMLAGAMRTPIGRFGGRLAPLSAVDLACHAAKAALDKAGVRADQVNQAVFGHARQAGRVDRDDPSGLALRAPAKPARSHPLLRSIAGARGCGCNPA